MPSPAMSSRDRVWSVSDLQTWRPAQRQGCTHAVSARISTQSGRDDAAAMSHTWLTAMRGMQIDDAAPDPDRSSKLMVTERAGMEDWGVSQSLLRAVMPSWPSAQRRGVGLADTDCDTYT
eukprot:1230146-Rhodomonas_salina.2